MSSDVSQVSTTAEPQAEEPYIPVEELAQRLDLPLALILRRIEAGDVPARRIEGGGSGWGLRLSDLGIESGTEREEEGQIETHARATIEGQAAPEPAVSQTPEADAVAEGEPSGDAIEPADAPIPEAPIPEAPIRGTPVEPEAMFSGRVTRYERGTRGPRSEVAGMLIDSRELVSGLLDRWERTLEQRIHIEQRQRFEGELNARQNLVKQLQLELQTARAEHAAYAADRDRHRAELERQVADLQRELAAANEAAASRRRGLFHRR